MPNSGDRTSIVFVLGHYGVGGAEKQLANLIANRPSFARDPSVHVITLLPPTSGEVARQFTRAGAATILVDRSQARFAPFFLQLLAVMKRLRPAAVCTILEESTGTWGRLAAWLTGVPAIYHSDRALGFSITGAQRRLRPFLDQRTTGFLPNASAIGRQLEALGIPPEKIHVVHNGVDVKYFDLASAPTFRTELNIPHDEVVLGFLGRFDAIKRIDLLLDAVLRLKPEDRPDWILLGGDGDETPGIKQTIAGNEWLTDHCRLMGTVSDTPGYLSSIDYLVLASDAEGFPNVVLEAMAMGKPVVATRVSDIPELIGDTGALAEPGDVYSLAGAIGWMQSLSREDRTTLGERARKNVWDNYSITAAAERFWGTIMGHRS